MLTRQDASCLGPDVAASCCVWVFLIIGMTLVTIGGGRK